MLEERPVISAVQHVDVHEFKALHRDRHYLAEAMNGNLCNCICPDQRMATKFSASFSQVGFRSVVVITLASHARGPGFETQRKQLFCPWKPFLCEQDRGQ